MKKKIFITIELFLGNWIALRLEQKTTIKEYVLKTKIESNQKETITIDKSIHLVLEEL